MSISESSYIWLIYSNKLRDSVSLSKTGYMSLSLQTRVIFSTLLVHIFNGPLMLLSSVYLSGGPTKIEVWPIKFCRSDLCILLSQMAGVISDILMWNASIRLAAAIWEGLNSRNSDSHYMYLQNFWESFRNWTICTSVASIWSRL